MDDGAPKILAAPAIWVLRTAALSGGRFEVVSLISNHYPDGTVIDPGPRPEDFPGALELSSLRLDASGRPVATVASWATSDAPSLWYVEMDASTPNRSMHSVIAFDTGHLPEGTFVSNAAFFTMPVRSNQQIGAVRWDTVTGEIDQAFVAPETRRQQVARKMIVAAAAFGRYRGWSGKMHVGGRRGDVVEQILEGKAGPRVLPRTERTIIMDPLTGDVAE